MGMRRGEEHRGARNYKGGSKKKKTCQSDEGKNVEEHCDRYNEGERGGNGQSEGGTAPQMLLWGSEWREKMNELTPSTKSRGTGEKRTSERKDTEELNRAKKRLFWQDHPPCRFQEDQSAQGSTGVT